MNIYLQYQHQRLFFDGFMSVYKSDDDNEETNALAKGLDENSVLTLDDVNGTQHFTQPPAHFTEASLVKALEEQGIGRPSTYAPTISTIIARHYVIKENKNLYISELGNAVNNIMMTAFPTIVDVKLQLIWSLFLMVLLKEPWNGRKL